MKFFLLLWDFAILWLNILCTYINYKEGNEIWFVSFLTLSIGLTIRLNHTMNSPMPRSDQDGGEG